MSALEAFKTIIDDISHRNKEIQQIENARIKKLQNFQEEIQSLQKKIGSMEEDIKRLNSELFEERSLKKEQITLNSKISNEVGHLNKENQILKRENDSLRNDLNTAIDKLKKLERDLEDYQKHSNESKNVMRQAKEKICDLEIQILKQHQDFKILEEQLIDSNLKQMASF